MNFMNTSNPFQIPVCLQRADSQQRRRERFKRGFIAIVAAIVVLLVGLLIEGCMTEKSTGPAPTPGQTITVQPTPQSYSDSVADPKSDQSTQPKVAVARQTTQPTTSSTGTTSPVSHSAKTSIYTVKSGDTLSHIAKTHGITLKALRAANNLEGDRIVVGAKLKIPEA